MENGEEINSRQYVEVVLTGGIGVAKTTLALYSQAYQLYNLSVLLHAAQTYDLDPSSEILMVFQSLEREPGAGRRLPALSRHDRQASPFFDDFPYDRRRGGNAVPAQHRRQAGLGPRHRRDRPERHRRRSSTK